MKYHQQLGARSERDDGKSFVPKGIYFQTSQRCERPRIELRLVIAFVAEQSSSSISMMESEYKLYRMINIIYD